jgi:hypothetical protein
LIVRGIDQSMVDEVWRELTSYPAERIASEAAAFGARQPHVAAFADAAMGEQDRVVHQAALGLSFLVFKVLERSLGRPFPTVEPTRLGEAHERTRRWLGDTADDPGRTLAHAVDPRRPTLAGHVLSVFYGDSLRDCDERVQASLYVLLETLVDVLDLGPAEA